MKALTWQGNQHVEVTEVADPVLQIFRRQHAEAETGRWPGRWRPGVSRG